ncbi:MAG: orotidine-5'-phosphate decarboxylase [Lachnospiraceae bacterium]|nr:orotidine-5'-phosphate decarboxylase [Lachnospiraceae bacterium]
MIQKLIANIEKTNAPVVVGLDPMLSYIPKHILDAAYEEKGANLSGACAAVFEYNKQIVDAIYDLIPAVKPQVAMYEQFGVEGMEIFKKTVDYCKEKGLVVIGDIKRGDIGSTSKAYADGHIGYVEIEGKKFFGFDEDMVTVNPYLGTDGIKPFLEVCNECDRGIFVLVKTSNPSSGEFQDRLSDGKPIYEYVCDKVNEWGDMCMEGNYSNVGCVVGATYPETGAILRKKMPHSFILVPGYGAQGGKAEDLKAYFNSDGLGAIVNSSRGIITAYKNEKYSNVDEKEFYLASRQAVIDMIEDINSVR